MWKYQWMHAVHFIATKCVQAKIFRVAGVIATYVRQIFAGAGVAEQLQVESLKTLKMADHRLENENFISHTLDCFS